jgi:hypothetical protein
MPVALAMLHKRVALAFQVRDTSGRTGSTPCATVRTTAGASIITRGRSRTGTSGARR